MLRIITGNPGSGKSYYAVNYLKKFVEYDKLYNTMILKDSVLLVTNIEDIKIPHMTYDDFVKQGYMNIEKLRQFITDQKYRKIIIIIDECQRYFGGLRDNETFFFFEYHRHLGIDLFLICQTIAALPRRLSELCEFILEARPRMYAIAGFAYDMKDPRTGERISKITITKNTDVFKLYQSFTMDEDKSAKPKKILLTKYAVSIGAIALLLFGAQQYLRNGFAFTDKKNKEPIKTEQLKVEQKQQIETKKTNDINKPQQNQSQQQNAVVNTNTAKEITKIQSVLSIKPHRTPDKNITGVAIVGDQTYIFSE